MVEGAAEYDHVNRKLTCLLFCALHRRTIRLTCPSCQLVRRLDAVGLWWLFEKRRWDDALPAAWQRLYCPDCWNAHQRKVRPQGVITREPADPVKLPYPDEREWRQVVSRYRS